MALATIAGFAFLLSIGTMAVTSVLVYRSYADDLKPPTEAISAASVGSSIAYDRNGNRLYEYTDEHAGLRDPVPLAEISPYLIAATIATEDATFFDNPGVNFEGLARAGMENLTPFGGGFFGGSGGSSITQQLVKNVYIPLEERQSTGPDAIDRKLEETVIALELKRKYSDNQILEWYLNQIFYGRQSYGIEASSLRFFGKHASELTLAEAALLAGLPQRPGFYNPHNVDINDHDDNPATPPYDPDGDPATPPLSGRDLSKVRQGEVLELMIRNLDSINSMPGIADPDLPMLTITAEEINAAREAPLPYIELASDIVAPHWVLYVRDQVEKMCAAGLFPSPGDIPCDKVVTQGGLRITSTLDLGLNSVAQQVIEEEISASEERTNGHNSSLVAIQPSTGQILAYVGSRQYGREDIDGSVDIASSLQSHGSTMKMFTYLKAFEDGWVPSTLVEDKKLLLDVGGVQREVNNWNLSHMGTITLRKGFSESVNTTAVRTLMDVGEDRMREIAHRIGITDLRQGDCGPTITLGACEVKLVDQTFAFAVLANNGVMIGRPTSEDLPTGFRTLDQVSVLKITDSEGNLIYEYTTPEQEQVVDPAHAYMVTDVLSKEAISWSRLTLDNRPAAVKTGTSEDFRDGVIMGYTPDLSVGVWMGNADNTPMAPGTFSSQGVGPTWRRFMNEAHAYLQIPKHDFVIPDSIQFLSCAGRPEVFKKNTPTVKNGSCRGPSGQPDVTASPTPRGPVFPTDTPAPTPTPVNETPTPQAESPTPTSDRPEITYYQTRPGDTVRSVAEQFGVDVEDLAKANGITPDTPIEPGLVLVIPGG